MHFKTFRCGSQRCGLCKIGILVETKNFFTFTVRFKCRIFRPLNMYTADNICKMTEFLIDNIFVQLGG